MDSEIAEILAGQKQLEIKFESVSDAMHDHDTHPGFNFWDLSRQCPLCDVCVYIYIYIYLPVYRQRETGFSLVKGQCSKR